MPGPARSARLRSINPLALIADPPLPGSARRPGMRALGVTRPQRGPGEGGPPRSIGPPVLCRWTRVGTSVGGLGALPARPTGDGTSAWGEDAPFGEHQLRVDR